MPRAILSFRQTGLSPSLALHELAGRSSRRWHGQTLRTTASPLPKSRYTGSPEILSGRVKSCIRRYTGLLAARPKPTQ